MLRNIIYFGGSVILFFAGMVIYGIILNTREISLEEALEQKNITDIANPVLVIEKLHHRMYLYDDTVMVKSYKTVLGKNLADKRLALKNNVTPTGNYFICEIDSVHRYYKFIRLNHPNTNDATEALREGVINSDEFNRIFYENEQGNCPDPPDVFTQELGIHGIGEYNIIFKNLPFIFDWTNGSVAISNEGIDELCSVISVGTRVIIR